MQEDGEPELRTGEKDPDRRHQRKTQRDRETTEGENDTSNRHAGLRQKPWARENNPAWARDADDTRETRERRTDRGWRERNVGDDRRLRDTGSKTEQEPEWMDPVELKKEDVHTQEEFQRWKERMKASSQAEVSSAPDTAPVDPEKESVTAQKKSDNQEDGELGRLFGMWSEPKRQDSGPAESTATARTSAGKPKTSRFAGFFTPKDELVVAQPEPPDAPESSKAAGPSSSADQEGFARILQMLGGTNTVQVASSSVPKRPSEATSPAKTSEPRQAFQESPLPARTRQDLPPPNLADLPRSRSPSSIFPSSHSGSLTAPPPKEEGRRSRIQPPGSQDQPKLASLHQGNGPQALFSPSPSTEGRPKPLNRDSEFLLNLMQQSTIDAKAQRAAKGVAIQRPHSLP